MRIVAACALTVAVLSIGCTSNFPIDESPRLAADAQADSGGVDGSAGAQNGDGSIQSDAQGSGDSSSDSTTDARMDSQGDGTEDSKSAGDSSMDGSAEAAADAKGDVSTASVSVTFNLNGGSGTVPGAQVALVDSTLTLPSKGDALGPEVIANSGITQTFLGWSAKPIGGTLFPDGSTYDVPGNDTVLYAQWTKDISVLRKIGPSGGYVFFDKGAVSDGWRYMEVATDDQLSILNATPWSNVVDQQVGTELTIGSGQRNTTKIINQPGHITSAALLCDQYSVTVQGLIYDDWFLPSLEELKAVGTGVFDGTGLGALSWDYWTSSERVDSPATSAWVVWFGDVGSGDYEHSWMGNRGKSTNVAGGQGAKVRAIREFGLALSYNSGAGAGSAPQPQYIAGGTPVTLPGQGQMTAPSSAKHWAGWSTEATGGSLVSSPFVMPSAPTKLYAQWQ